MPEPMGPKAHLSMAGASMETGSGSSRPLGGDSAPRTPAERTPLPGLVPAPPESQPAGGVEPRIMAAWREWLAALATDAEAAIAAAHVYGELPGDARDAWLDALAEDCPKLSVPKIAIYAPLLSVETDATRRGRIERAIGDELVRTPLPARIRALRGIAADSARLVILVSPLYLSFVQVLSCRFSPDYGFVWVRHDPILRTCDAPVAGSLVDDVLLEVTPLKPIVEELAHAVLAQRRSGRELPSPLRCFAHLFDAHLEGESFP